MIDYLDGCLRTSPKKRWCYYFLSRILRSKWISDGDKQRVVCTEPPRVGLTRNSNIEKYRRVILFVKASIFFKIYIFFDHPKKVINYSCLVPLQTDLLVGSPFGGSKNTHFVRKGRRFYIICSALPYCHNVCFSIKLWMYVIIYNLVL